MAELNLTARAIYPDGARGPSIARVSGASATECLAAIAPALERWLAHARHAGNGRAPRELELRLGWRGPEHSPAGRPCPLPPRPRGEARAASDGGQALRRRMQCLSGAARSRPAPRPASGAAAGPGVA